MQIPDNYLEKLYAGWLGKIIGIRAGANIEGWTYEKIRDTYGELDGYPADFINFAADDDSNGPFFFLRGLKDSAVDYQLVPQNVADALLNYASFEHGFFWWGGYGVSTEHTAYLNLRSGIPAPQSGSIAQNGATVAEQIGGQIFIDSWGLVAPGNPELAAQYAKAAASVTHDGNGIYGGIFIAVAVSWAFVENDLERILDKASSFIPADCEYLRVVNAMRAFHRQHPDDWRAAFAYLKANFGYDRYPGNCHIIPNAGVVILALLYGNGDFTRTINICNMCGWDTDCNVANAGCITGVRNGLQGIDYDKWRKPINDLLICSSVVGSLNILDIPYCASYTASLAYGIAGQQPDGAAWKDIFSNRMDSCHFEYPGSTHAIRTRTDGTVTIENSDEQAYTGARSLKICGTATGTPTAIYRQTYYQPEDFSDSRYDPSFSPVLYPGQTIRASVFSTEATGTVQMYAKDLHSGKLVLGEKVNLLPGQWITPQLAIPAMDGALLGEAGLLVECEQDWCIYLDDLVFDGKPSYSLIASAERMERYTFAHIPVSQFTTMKGLLRIEDDQLIHLSCADFGEAYTGRWDWKDYTAEFTVIPVNGKEWGVNVRVQGAMRSYAVTFGDGTLSLRKNQNGYRTLWEIPFDWQPGRRIDIRIQADGNTLTVWADGNLIRAYTDTDHPLLEGTVGISVSHGGHCCLDTLRIS